GHQEDIQVDQPHRGQRVPGELHVPAVDLRDPCPQPITHRVLREVRQSAAEDVAAGVAGQCVEPDQRDVDDHEDGPETDTEPAVPAVEGYDGVIGQHTGHRDGGVPEVAVN